MKKLLLLLLMHVAFIPLVAHQDATSKNSNPHPGSYLLKQVLGSFAILHATNLAHEMGHGLTAMLLLGPKTVKGLSIGGHFSDGDTISGPLPILIKSINPLNGASIAVDFRQSYNLPVSIKKAALVTMLAAGPIAGMAACKYIYKKLTEIKEKDSNKADNNSHISLPIFLTLLYSLDRNFENLFALDGAKDGDHIAEILNISPTIYNTFIGGLGVIGCSILLNSAIGD